MLLRFSALQRAENSSITDGSQRYSSSVSFQCSSASRKFLNSVSSRSASSFDAVSVLFSEPKIPQCVSRSGKRCISNAFQCSSASRKFLNEEVAAAVKAQNVGFSALQRAENSSIGWGNLRRKRRRCVSVLFSEPKIPQFSSKALDETSGARFQCSSASRKFLNVKRSRRRSRRRMSVSVLFSEPKIPQLAGETYVGSVAVVFQCSSASRKFLNLAAKRWMRRAAQGFSALQRAENSSM